MKKTLLVALLSILFLGACSSVPKEESGVVYLTVASQQADCTGVAPQKCLIIKKGAERHWVYLYSGIEGFSYTPGYEYRIQVRKEKVLPIPADVSTIRYVFVKEISKEQKSSTGLPGIARER